jgi:syntaxin 5
MSVDRTQLFFELVSKTGSQQTSVLTTSSSQSPLSAEALVRSNTTHSSSPFVPSSFTRAAGEVSRDLQKTAKLIQELTQLVKRRGVFDGAATSQAIETITNQVKSDVSRLSNQLDGLQSFVDAKRDEAIRAGAAPGKPKANTITPTTTTGVSISTSGSSTNTSYDVLNSIHGLSHSDMVLASLKQQLLGFSVGLRDVISARGEGLKQARDRRSAFGRTAAKDLGRPLELAAPPPLPLTSSIQSKGVVEIVSVPVGSQHYHQNQKPSFETAVQRMPPSSASAFQIVTQQQLDPEVAFVNSRAQDVRHVEAAVTEIATLFGRLATLVAEQGNQIDRIDGDIENAGGQMDLASAQLQRAYDTAASNRMLALRIIGVLIAFIFGFVFFVV